MNNGSFPRGTKPRLYRNEQPPSTQQGLDLESKRAAFANAVPAGQLGLYTKHIGGGLSSTLKYISHTETEKELVFVLKNETIEVKAHYEFFCGIKVVRTYCEIEISNISNQDIILEHVSSFRMYGFSIDMMPMRTGLERSAKGIPI